MANQSRIEMIRDSVEYLVFYLTERDGEDISSNPVQVALVAPDATGTPAWQDATPIVGDSNRWRSTAPFTWSAANYPATHYKAWAKVTDTPETPWVSLGTVVITSY